MRGCFRGGECAPRAGLRTQAPMQACRHAHPLSSRAGGEGPAFRFGRIGRASRWRVDDADGAQHYRRRLVAGFDANPESFPRWRAAYFLSRKESRQRRLLTSTSNLPSAAWPGFFDKTSLSCRKTADLLSAALRVYDPRTAHRHGDFVGTIRKRAPCAARCPEDRIALFEFDDDSIPRVAFLPSSGRRPGSSLSRCQTHQPLPFEQGVPW
jgi:hypothetical protein